MNLSALPQPPSDDKILWRHLVSLPYFRAMVRAVEDSFYQGLELPEPVCDLGSGDGHFASLAFAQPLDVGLDPWWEPLSESRKYKAYRLLIQADGARIPFPSAAFASVISNSVLEHIPHVDEVVAEVGRIIRPNGRFVFCVPNHRFPRLLMGVQVCQKLGLHGLGEWYSRFFNRISRHQHCDSREVWEERLGQAGFVIERQWDYFPAEALHRMEVGHVLGLPALFWKKIVGHWLLAPNRANLAPVYRIASPVFRQPLSPEGVYSFYITRKVAPAPSD
jgi:SAM-dependent methyltransferase